MLTEKEYDLPDHPIKLGLFILADRSFEIVRDKWPPYWFFVKEPNENYAIVRSKLWEGLLLRLGQLLDKNHEKASNNQFNSPRCNSGGTQNPYSHILLESRRTGT